MSNLQSVSVRDLQHNLSDYLELAKSTPLMITKYGKEEALLVSSRNYRIAGKKGKKESKVDIMMSPFIGMHKDKKEWKNKTSLEITDELRKRAWYGG